MLDFLLLQGAVVHGECGDLPAGCGPPGSFPTRNNIWFKFKMSQFPQYPPHFGSYHVSNVFLNP